MDLPVNEDDGSGSGSELIPAMDAKLVWSEEEEEEEEDVYSSETAEDKESYSVVSDMGVIDEKDDEKED